MADDNIFKLEKTITLNKLKPNEYLTIGYLKSRVVLR